MPECEVGAIEQTRVACRNCSIGGLCIPSGLNGEDIEHLEQIVKRSKPLHRGDYLFRSGDKMRALFIIKTGSVKTTSPNEDGHERIIGFHLPGEMVGLDAIQREVHGSSAMVLETCVACEIPFKKLEELASNFPALQRQMYRLLSREIAQNTETLMLISKKNADERLAAFLINLSERLKRRGLSPTEFYLSMSRYEIGNYLGLAVETISRLFSRFQTEGLLRVDRKHVFLLDISRMEAILAGRQINQ